MPKEEYSCPYLKESMLPLYSHPLYSLMLPLYSHSIVPLYSLFSPGKGLWCLYSPLYSHIHSTYSLLILYILPRKGLVVSISRAISGAVLSCRGQGGSVSVTVTVNCEQIFDVYIYMVRQENIDQIPMRLTATCPLVLRNIYLVL